MNAYPRPHSAETLDSGSVDETRSSAVSARTIILDCDGAVMDETPRLFIPVYRGLMLELPGGRCVSVVSAEWDLGEESTLCRLTVAPVPPELLDEGPRQGGGESGR